MENVVSVTKGCNRFVRLRFSKGGASSLPFSSINLTTAGRKHLSFHSVSFGPRNEVLRRMAHIARDVQARAPRDPALPPTAYVESSYAEALDSVCDVYYLI